MEPPVFSRTRRGIGPDTAGSFVALALRVVEAVLPPARRSPALLTVTSRSREVGRSFFFPYRRPFRHARPDPRRGGRGGGEGARDFLGPGEAPWTPPSGAATARTPASALDAQIKCRQCCGRLQLKNVGTRWADQFPRGGRGVVGGGGAAVVPAGRPRSPPLGREFYRVVGAWPRRDKYVLRRAERQRGRSRRGGVPRTAR